MLLVDEFEEAKPVVWNSFVDPLKTGSYMDSQGTAHDLEGFVVVFATNCPLEKIGTTFPAELLSRFSLKVHFSRLTSDEKAFFVKKYILRIAEKYKN